MLNDQSERVEETFIYFSTKTMTPLRRRRYRLTNSFPLYSSHFILTRVGII